MVVEFALDALGTWDGLGLQAAALVAMAAAAIFMYGYQAVERRRRGLGLGLISDLPKSERSRGLIFLYSVEPTLREAVGYHKPDFCWLVVTPEKRSEAQEAIAHLLGDFPQLRDCAHGQSV